MLAGFALGGKAGRNRNGMARLYPAPIGVNHEPSTNRCARWIPTLDTGVRGAFNKLVLAIFKLLRGICTPSTPLTYGSSSRVWSSVSLKNILDTFRSSYRPLLNNRYHPLQSPSVIPNAIKLCFTVCRPKLKISPNTIPTARQYRRSCPNAA